MSVMTFVDTDMEYGSKNWRLIESVLGWNGYIGLCDDTEHSR